VASKKAKLDKKNLYYETKAYTKRVKHKLGQPLCKVKPRPVKGALTGVHCIMFLIDDSVK